MADVLEKLPPAELAGWYRRLADRIALKKVDGNEPLSAILLRHWLDNRDPKQLFTFTSPAYLQQSKYVAEVLIYHRQVFLTEKPARVGGGEKWAGIVPRLQGSGGYPKWTGTGMLSMEYESLVEVGVGAQLFGSDADKDLLYALHGFQLKSMVAVTVSPAGPMLMTVTFARYQAKVRDYYDWDPTKHISVPNPDYKSKAPGAVEPSSDQIVVYHSNAKRLEKAGLAAPYPLESDAWSVTVSNIIKPATVDISRSL